MLKGFKPALFLKGPLPQGCRKVDKIIIVVVVVLNRFCDGLGVILVVEAIFNVGVESCSNGVSCGLAAWSLFNSWLLGYLIPAHVLDLQRGLWAKKEGGRRQSQARQARLEGEGEGEWETLNIAARKASTYAVPLCAHGVMIPRAHEALKLLVDERQKEVLKHGPVKRNVAVVNIVAGQVQEELPIALQTALVHLTPPRLDALVSRGLARDVVVAVVYRAALHATNLEHVLAETSVLRALVAAHKERKDALLFNCCLEDVENLLSSV